MNDSVDMIQYMRDLEEASADQTVRSLMLTLTPTT